MGGWGRKTGKLTCGRRTALLGSPLRDGERGRRKKGKLTREDAQHYSGLLNAIPDISVRPWIPNYQIHFRTGKHLSLTHTYISVYIYIYI